MDFADNGAQVTYPILPKLQSKNAQHQKYQIQILHALEMQPDHVARESWLIVHGDPSMLCADKPDDPHPRSNDHAGY